MQRSLSNQEGEKITLGPLSEMDYKIYMGAHVIEHAHDRVITDYETLDDAEDGVRSRLAATLPKGMETPHHHFYSIQLKDKKVGWVWLNIKKAEKLAFLYYIFIEKDHRGRGIGKEVMRLIFDEAKTLGASVLWLNVMEHNPAAKRLYESVGMKTAAIHMNLLLK